MNPSNQIINRVHAHMEKPMPLFQGRSGPYFSLLFHNSCASSYTIIGGLIGTVYGYEIGNTKRYNVLITDKHIADLNYSYLIVGGAIGMSIGSIIGNIIKWI